MEGQSLPALGTQHWGQHTEISSVIIFFGSVWYLDLNVHSCNFFCYYLLLLQSHNLPQHFLTTILTDNCTYFMTDLLLMDEILFVDNLPYKTSWTCYPGWRKAWKPESCHNFHAWRRLTNNRYESGTSFFANLNLIFFMLRPNINCTRITTWKKLLKWETCSKNFLKGMIWDTHQF